jgi:membrane protease YdiL (CAAX protease family)
MAATISPVTPATRPATEVPNRRLPLLWVGFVVVSLLALDVLDQTVWAIAIPMTAGALWLGSTSWWRPLSISRPGALDARDLAVVAGLYVAVVGLWRLAFTVFTADRWLPLFLCFGGGMLLGVAGPVVYTVWLRRRPLASLGLGAHRLRSALALGLLFAAVQAATMFWGYQLPAPVGWVPLLVLALTVGLFEAVFFRGFVQGRLEVSFGTGPAVAGAAVLYAIYHVGYGMGVGDMGFLFALGVVYAVAYRLTGNVLVLWPLLTPLGGCFSYMEAGDFQLPWASIAGFADVLGLMALVIWLAYKRQRRRALAQGGHDDACARGVRVDVRQHPGHRRGHRRGTVGSDARGGAGGWRRPDHHRRRRRAPGRWRSNPRLRNEPSPDTPGRRQAGHRRAGVPRDRAA